MGSRYETHLHFKWNNGAGCKVELCVLTNHDDEHLYGFIPIL